MSNERYDLRCFKCSVSAHRKSDPVRSTLKTAMALAYTRGWHHVNKQQLCPQCFKKDNPTAYYAADKKLTKESFQRLVTRSPQAFPKYHQFYVDRYPMSSDYGFWVRENHRADFNEAFATWVKVQAE